MKIRILIFICFLCLGCSKVEPRKPINPKKSTTILKETIKESIRLNTIEDDKILNIIKLDSTKIYQVSPNGFWYTYINKKEENTPTPITGDEVSIEYNITDLQGGIIYTKEELGLKNYKVDKEDFISALQTGIKLMKVGETITFVIPSYNAFGISGDGNKIGINQSIKSTVTLINIK
ncbi:gliding motility-associated peptidyl-prolyl isomerase GldI [Polaribacter sp. Hel1_85]|uniref:gliding motility-associated peptidyl-prolyl isomerase GldI n=1 Tax=Polaribacter sp. Hel1_85 TaxID=1250005 RepID=UPI00052C1F1F|nr:gliding motility-associated peptidyl-prolyl isomerase GldI [Polaribacter sp. Hel1_85]KGL63692.1 gliding motility protein GldI [Polaribacter sp. Hel1_85]